MSHICKYAPPSRVWEQTETGLWHSRPWRKGERAAYARVVLGWNWLQAQVAELEPRSEGDEE